MTSSISPRVYILLKDQNGKSVAIFDDFISLSCTKVVNDVGSYTLSIRGDDPKRSLFELDGQIEVYRSIPGTKDWYKEFEGFHRKSDKVMGNDGKIVFTSTGVGYNDLLARTIIAFKAGTIRASKNCSAETAMKEYVGENCMRSYVTPHLYSPSVSPSMSPSVSPSTSPSVSPSASASLSPSISKSVSASLSPSASASASRSPSVSPSASRSISPSASKSPSSSGSPSPSPSAAPYVTPPLPPYATVVGRLADGYLPGFGVETDKTPTADTPIRNWSGDKAYENLLDVLKEIATFSGIDFAVVGNGPAQFIFNTYLEGMGLDKTYHTVSTSGLNEAGNAPVVFSALFSSISSATYSNDRLSESNVVVIQGDGEGSTKHTVTRSDPSAVDDSPWNRREVSRSSNSSEFTYQMNDFGDATLKELSGKETIGDCIPLQTPRILYGVNYELGDKVTVWFDDVKMDKRIISVTLEYGSGGSGENVSMELADAP